jgi:L-seryl-tRNA(Ser) seleniumtransferase
MNKEEALRRLPAVHRLLKHPLVQEAFADVPLSLATAAIGDALDELRQIAKQSAPEPEWWERETSPVAVIARAERCLQSRLAPRLRRVLNLTGTVIHTNLGRAPLSERAQQAVLRAAAGYTNLEYRLADGTRGSRHDLVEARLRRLIGAEAACVVNNNAAAVMLVLRALAQGGEVIVSRGQLVEIGGSFRIPDVLQESGVKLVEVGTTNKTRIVDYERAWSEHTRAIVRVHTSNYRIIGFTEQPALESLVELGRRWGVPVIEDLGSGALFDFEQFGVGDEPVVSRSLAAGVDVVTFSGDKLLGGAQAGIIAGKREYIDQVRKHPLMRALRVDKLTLAALEATLIAYEDEQLAMREIPVVRMLTEPVEVVADRAERVLRRLQADESCAEALHMCTVETTSTVGGGALPGTELPTCAIALQPRNTSTQQLFDALRTIPSVPVIARVVRDTVLLDVRTLLPGEEDTLVDSVREVCRHWRAPSQPGPREG